MPRRRKLSLASLAAVALLACGAGVWLLGDLVAAKGNEAQGSKLGTPFRATDAGRERLALVSVYDTTGSTTGAGSQAVDTQKIIKLLQSRGFSDIDQMRQRGGTFICEATGPRRERVRLVVDVGSGEISGIQVIGFADPRP